jgi:hypothetical protein
VEDGAAQEQSLAAQLLREARDALGGSRALTLALERAGITGASGSAYTGATVESWLTGRSAPPVPVFVAALRLGRVHVDRHLYPGEQRPVADEARLRRVEQKTDTLLQAIEDCMTELRETADGERRERVRLQLQLTNLASRLEASASPSPQRRGPSDPLVLG